jgi:hypothetical protein
MWPFAGRYPERSCEDVDGKEYDYVIVGGKSPTLSLCDQSASVFEFKLK